MHCKRTFSALLALVLALTAAISIPVQAAAADATRLPNSAIAFGDDIIYDKFDALPMPNKGGFYYANAGAVWFCNPSAGTTRKVHAFTGNSAVACTYADTDTHKFYLLYTANSTGYLGTFDAATEQVTTKKIDDFLPSGCNPRSVGVDSQGRYYFSVQIYTICICLTPISSSWIATKARTQCTIFAGLTRRTATSTLPPTPLALAPLFTALCAAAG